MSKVKKLPRAEFYNVSCGLVKECFIDSYQFFMFNRILKVRYQNNGKDIDAKDYIQWNLN